MVSSWYLVAFEAVNIHWFIRLTRHRTYDSSSYAPIFSPLLSTSDADWESIPWSHHLKHPPILDILRFWNVYWLIFQGWLSTLSPTQNRIYEVCLLRDCWCSQVYGKFAFESDSGTPWNYALKCLIITTNTALSWDGGIGGRRDVSSWHNPFLGVYVYIAEAMWENC